MNFLSNVLDSIPVVGHVKGVVHYAVGDTEGGHKAMYQSTRTSAVLAGGAAGCVAGPAGAALGAMYAGLATDGLASVAMDKPQGIVQSCENIGKDIAAGRNPTGSILSTGLQVGLDGVGGLGMGGLSSAASKVSEKAVTKTIENVGKKAISTVGEEVIEKSVKLTAEEMAKLVGKKVSQKAMEKAVQKAVIQAEVGMVTAHVAASASKRTQQEENEKKEKRAKERRDREDRERRDKEKRDREERDRQERQERARRERERQANEGKQQRSQGTSSQPPQPPQGNNNKQNKNKNQPDYYDMFMKLLRRLLKLIYGDKKEVISAIFANLSEGQINYLITIIESLIKSGTFEEVVELVIKIFKEHMSEHVSFENFLSLFEFVRTYLLDELDTRGTESTRYTQGTYQERRARILADIKNEKDIINKIVRLFRKLEKEIKAETAPPNGIDPDFRDIFAAVYHYFKHRRVPETEDNSDSDSEDGILTVKQYYDWIRKVLKMLKKNSRYQQEVENQRGPVTCRYEIYVVLFGRRFRIVVKVRRGRLVLSSAFVVEIPYDGDAEGFEHIDIRKK